MSPAPLPTAAAAPVAGPLAGDYYGRHDKCLYRVSGAAGAYQLARCRVPADTPAADVFDEAYPLQPNQLERLLAFGGLEPVPS